MRGGNHAKQSDINEEETRPTCSVQYSGNAFGAKLVKKLVETEFPAASFYRIHYDALQQEAEIIVT